MNQSIKQVAGLCRWVTGDRRALNRVEAVIRCYDPCLSCSTHALGDMPLLLKSRVG
jgi:NAD-reducing hydrogenase large subunit